MTYKRQTNPRPGRGTSPVATSYRSRREEFRGSQYQQWPSQDDSRAADLSRRGLPANIASGPSRRGLDGI